MAKTHWFEGRTVSEAIAAAESALGMQRDQMDIEVVSTGRRGILGFGSSPAVIKVRVAVDGEERAEKETLDKDLELLVSDVAAEIGDRNGLAGVKDGKVVIIPPRGNGKYPTIVPCPEVRLRINGITYTKRAVVTERDDIEVEILPTDDPKPYNVEIAKDGLVAYLTVCEPVKTVRRLVDKEPAIELELAVEETHEPLPPVSVDEVVGALRQNGVVYGLDEQRVKEAVAQSSGRPVPVAFGRPAVPGRDGYLDLIYERRDRERSAGDETERVDFRELSVFYSVEAGEVIARVVEPVPGQPGMTVTGQEIIPAEPKPVSCRLGTGVRQVDDRVIATVGGRPRVTGKLIEVLPSLFVQGDVDITTGNIRFPGDVIITGNVNPGMSVKADGMIKIFGIVEKARILARDGVICLDSVVNSRVQAGGETAELSKILPMVKRMLHDLEVVDDAIRQVNMRLQWRGKDPAPAGRIMEVLIEKKLKNLPHMAKELLQVCEEKGITLGETDTDMFKSLTKMVLNPVPALAADSDYDVSDHVNKLKEWISDTESRMKRKSDVHLRYALNSEVYATGSITVSGQGCFNSLLSAAERVTVKGTPGVFRGGQIIAANDVYVRELGSEAGTVTRVNVTENRRVVCERVLGNVLIGIGRNSVRIDDPRENVLVWMDEEGRIRMR